MSKLPAPLNKLPFPVMHVDTQWKFQEMYSFRDKMVAELGLDLNQVIGQLNAQNAVQSQMPAQPT